MLVDSPPQRELQTVNGGVVGENIAVGPVKICPAKLGSLLLVRPYRKQERSVILFGVYCTTIQL